VEGDSASGAELFALLSAIANIPIRQGIAVTGAVNPAGEILPVGGVTEKIEGYFAACLAGGLTGEQGVIVPGRNLASLCLRADVRDAVREGRFHVWAIDHIESGWPILTGLPAGEERPDGTYPEGSVYRAVADRLELWHRQIRGEEEFQPASEESGEADSPESPITVEL
jgi:predicted ATP-dependent protease